MRHSTFSKARFALLMLLPLMFAGCASWNPNQPGKADHDAKQAIAEFKKRDPSLQTFFANAYAYAIFPAIGKGGMGVGGAYGSGMVYRGDKLIALTSMTQVSIGWQLGGESYSELIFFENAKAFEVFKKGDLKFSAQVSAVAATAGAGAKTSYANNMAVFTHIKGGLMYEASVGGQAFSFEPVK